jgi:molecular chaperone HscB
MPADFLVQQMQWREALEESDSPASLQALATEVKQRQAHLLEQVQGSLDQLGDAARAAQQVRALMFVDRFAQEIDARIDQICA